MGRENEDQRRENGKWLGEWSFENGNRRRETGQKFGDLLIWKFENGSGTSILILFFRK